jgi:tetratricopeptide (TPR) repeat protein
MKEFKLLLVLFLILMSNYSCKKYLDEKSDKKLVTPEKIEDLQAILDESFNMNLNRTPAQGEVASDNYFLLDAIYEGLSDNARNYYVWKDQVSLVHPNDWSAGYIPVYVANLCLEQVTKINKTKDNESKINNVVGSALFFRSYNLLNLTWIYAKAYDKTTAKDEFGIVLRTETDFNSRSKRSNLEETYAMILTDAKEAVAYLPDNPVHVYRPSKAAAYGLISRAYLSMGNVDSAFKYADLSLKIKNQLIDYKNTTDVSVNGTNPFKQFNSETIFYTEMVFEDCVSPIYAKIDTNLYSLYANNDLRRLAFFRTEGKYKSFKGTYTGRRTTLFSGIATDEMFLNRAECYARLGDKDLAMKDLNTLLNKRYDASFSNLTASNSDEALTIILSERRKELLMRGLRWMDIKRLNKSGLNLVLKRNLGGQIYTLQPIANRYALPIPMDIIAITGMPQNPN